MDARDSALIAIVLYDILLSYYWERDEKEDCIMRRSVIGFLLLVFMLNMICPASADEIIGNRLYMAFGLYSVQTSSENANVPNTGNALGDYRYELDAFPELIYSNYAPLDSYEQTAQRKLNSHISYLFAAVLGDPHVYTESEVAEEVLPNGIRIRWQMMRGDRRHALWFEAFTDKMGYNVCVHSDPTDEQDEKLLSLMRSFEVNEDMEQDLILVRQTANGDGSFTSVDHGLKIQLDETWKPVEIEGMLLENTAFILEKDEGSCLIQLLHSEPCEAEDAPEYLKWYVENYQQGYKERKVYTIEIDGLDAVAYVLDTKENIYMKHVAFVYQNHCYYGSFMWIKPYNKQMRTFMERALMSITPGFSYAQ